MKICFMGTPEFALPTLKALAENHEVVAVISQPDKPKGRGKKLQPTPVKELALKLNLEVYQPAKIKDTAFIDVLKQLNADIFIVIAYGQILSEEVLNIPKFGCINVHGSLLPKYRGAAPIQWSIIDGEEVTGITIMQMDKGLDTGDIILQKQIPIHMDDNSGILHDKMSHLGAEALLEALKLIENGTAKFTKQDDSLSTYASMLTKKTGHINWEYDSQKIINLIRGLNPWPSAYTYINENEILKIWNAKLSDVKYSGVNGEVLKIDVKEGITVKTGDGAIVLTEVQGKSGKRMKATDYIMGHNIDTGIILK